MDKTYDPHSIEQYWYEQWEKQGHFVPQGEGTSYCIMIPPPNVTGTLHMGHAFQDTIMDALTRYHRMAGRPTVWQPGTDHAGIATQMVVERQLEAKGESRQELGREAFIDRVWEWKAQSGGAITQQLRRMGASVDWRHERFTMDEGLSAAVLETFVRLYDEGLIYRGKRLVNWDPVLRTAISDLEVVSEEEDGFLWHIAYPVADGEGSVTVATTRPETMLGDTAVAVHPQDPRFAHLIGNSLELPLTGRRIPVVADEYVDPEFGSGCVKITPAHDFNDYEVGERHGLEKINILTDDAHINDNAPEPYRGLTREQARRQVVADLKAQGFLVQTDKHRLMVPRGDRSQTVIEPYLTDQWYVKIAPLAGPAIEAVETGAIKFVPEHWSKTYFEWMHNIQDWCISRQLWWGHRIPAWYDEEGAVYVARNEAEVRAKYDLDSGVSLRQDDDVLDTWYSSGLWPFSTLGWPEQTDRLGQFYPTSVLVTGFDIIFFWVARMIMFGLKFMHEVPFREVYIHGLVRDADGVKMSKSKGNILDPLDLIDGIELEPLVRKRTSGLMQPQLAPNIEAATRKQYPDGIPAFGTDALRFTFCSLATQGRDIRFDLGRIEGYRNFCNKLWNAARYVVMNTQGYDLPSRRPTVEQMTVADRWIRARLQKATHNVHEGFAGYRFDMVAQAIYEFIWNEYCDWYVELCKSTLMDANTPAARKAATRYNLVATLEEVLRLAHPIMPFVTESIWQIVAPLVQRGGQTIMTQPIPAVDEAALDDEAVAEVEWLKTFVLGVRSIRGEMNVPPGKRVPVLLGEPTDQDRVRLDQNRAALEFLGRVEHIDILSAEEEAPDAATSLLGDTRILIPLAGLIDKAAETARLEKEIEKYQKDLGKCESKLANPKFVERAPTEVVAKERARVEELRLAIARFSDQLATLVRLD